jgi:hypothetical protein
MKTLGCICVLVLGAALSAADTFGQSLFRHPQPGEIYREYSRTMNSYADWRVTDPGATNPGAIPNLPNKTLSLSIGDLQGATRAEALIDLWQGHAGTTGKAIRFNNRPWIPIPDLSTPPTGGECYLAQYNVVVDIPLADLVQGNNTFQGTNGGQTCYDFGWGQHGMNGIVVRIYYDNSKAHPTGTITSPVDGATLGDDPTVSAAASGPAAIKQVVFVAYYNGPDTDGDGIYQDWQYNYHRAKSETSMRIKGHVGSDTTAPYGVTWSTGLVPDQAASSVKLVARIQDVNGIWFVTNEVSGLSLQRVGKAVRLYKAAGVPERFSMRLTRETKTCTFSIPSADRIADATAATMLISSFNGIDGDASIGAVHSTRVNSWTSPTYGQDHFYSLDYLTVPPAQLRSGTNTYTFFCNDSLTGTQIHWPGPQMLVTYVGDYASPAPAAPSPVSPANAASGVATSTTLRWTASGSATSYRVQVSLDAGFSSLVVDDSTVTDTSKAIGGLTFETLHYWRVSAKNTAGVSPYSPAWSFTTGSGAPVLVAPPDGASSLADPVTLQWRAQTGALAYWLQVSSDPLFGSFAVNDSTVLDTARAVAGLAGSQTYHWRVRNRTISGPGVFSPAWSFTTFLSLPAAVSLVLPADQDVIGADSVRFVWHRGEASVTAYWLEIGFDTAFTFRTIDSSLTDTTRVVHGLVNGNLYSWRMRARNASGWGPYSMARRFRPLYTGIEDESSLPAEFSLLQNYPNPFNPSTQVTFALPRESHVLLELYNMLGERVMTVVDASRPAGYHTVTVDAGNLSAGVYLYRLTAGERVMARKMLLVK